LNHCAGRLARFVRIAGQTSLISLTAKAGSRVKCRAGLYKCRSCRKQFTFKVGTIFEDSKIKCSKWCMAIALICSSKKAIGLQAET
jgi:hypothetical protein